MFIITQIQGEISTIHGIKPAIHIMQPVKIFDVNGDIREKSPAVGYHILRRRSHITDVYNRDALIRYLPMAGDPAHFVIVEFFYSISSTFAPLISSGRRFSLLRIFWISAFT